MPDQPSKESLERAARIRRELNAEIYSIDENDRRYGLEFDAIANERDQIRATASALADEREILEKVNEQLRQQNAALVEALRSSVVALDDWLNDWASDFCDKQRVEEARKRINEHGTIGYIATIQEKNRTALAPYAPADAPEKEKG